MTRTGPRDYFQYMGSTLLVLGGVLVGLLVLLALIVVLSARPATTPRRDIPAPRAPWPAEGSLPATSVPSTGVPSTGEVPAVR